MANPDHVAILLQGVEVWNNWLVDQREAHGFRADLSGFDIWSKKAQKSALFVALRDTLASPTYLDKKAPPKSPFWCLVPDLRGILLANVNLREAHLAGANFVEAHLEGAVFWGAHLEKASLEMAHLEEAMLREAHLEGADLWEAHLEGAHVITAHLEKAFLVGAHFDGAHLNGSHLEGANLVSADLRNTDVTGIHYDRRGKYQGIRLEGCYGSQRFVRHAKDQDYLEEMQESHPRVYRLWLWSSDCGRSFGRWALGSLLLALGFGTLYYALGLFSDAFHASYLGVDGKPGFWALQYYSVVTFTTLGFGDIVPRTGLAAFFVTLEVIAGYVMLGGLISIFANKLARRGG